MLNIIAELNKRLLGVIWDTDPATRPLWQNKGIGALRITYLIIRDVFFDTQLTLRAMSLVYTTLLSLVPLLAVSVSVLKGFGARNSLVDYLNTFVTPLGERGPEITQNIMNFVEKINSGLLGSVGIAVLLYTVISLMQKIESVFNFTWHVTEGRSFARRFSDYLIVVLIGPVLVFSAMGITATITHSKLFLLLASNPATGWMIILASHLVPYLLIILAFMLIYIYIPNTRVRLTAALMGAIVSGILWQTIGWMFASFVANANYTKIYSAFAAFFFFMIWLYISWTIMLTGASVAFYFQNPEYRIRQRRYLEISNRMKEKLALAIMALIVTHYYLRKPALNLRNLAQRINIATESLAPIINNLVECGLLTRTASEPTEFVPAQAPENVDVMDIMRAVREADEDDIMNASRITLSPEVETLFQAYQQTAAAALAGKTLKDLVVDVDTDKITQANAQQHGG